MNLYAGLVGATSDPEKTMAFLELKNISKGYGLNGHRTEVLNDINLDIERGEFVAIVGYSGAGKTTLLSLMAGLLRPDSGSIRLDGKEITGPGPDRGVVFQNYSLLPWRSVYGNIALAVAQAYPHWSRSQQDEWIDRNIALVNLSAARDKRPAELSGGMRQRVALARALAVDPQVLLLDEPLSALDALTRATLQDEIARVCSQEGKTVVLITNDVDEAILLADRIVPLSAGPRATFGPDVAVDLARPRNRKAINHDHHFQHIRNLVVTYLLGAGRKKMAGALPRLPARVPVAVSA